MADEPVEQTPNDGEEQEKKEFKFIRWDDSGSRGASHPQPAQAKRDEHRNAREIARAIESLSAREDVRLILLDAAPECEGYFSMGVGAEGYTQQMVFQMMDAFHNVFRAMLEMSKPVLAVVEGVASGAGAELAAFCDLVIATENAQFRQPEIKLGVFPPMGAVVYPRVIGPRRAMELLLTGDPINAVQAQQMGLVNRVVPRGEAEGDGGRAGEAHLRTERPGADLAQARDLRRHVAALRRGA